MWIRRISMLLMVRFSMSFTAVAKRSKYSRTPAKIRTVHTPEEHETTIRRTLSTATGVSKDERLELISWKDHPEIKKTVEFNSWICKKENCQYIISAPELQSVLGNVPGLSNRIRLVQHYNDTHHLILQNPNAEITQEIEAFLQSAGATTNGPTVPIKLNHTRWTVQHLLTTLLPEHAHPPPTAFEQVGHVAHLNLKKQHLPFKHLIGDVIESSLKTIETVVNKVGEVQGPYRIYDMELLAGRPDTNVTVHEAGIALKFDLAKTYWSARLSGQRSQLLRNEIRKDEIIADAFCGVGALCLMAAQKKNCIIWANDWNPHACEAIKNNAKANGVESKFLFFQRDAEDFLIDIGLEQGSAMFPTLPHHVVMNYPLESPKFLSALRWWPLPKRNENAIVPRFHVYTFAKATDSLSVEDIAIDLCANTLLPPGGAVQESEGRRDELNSLGCMIQARQIRDVAPQKVVVCVSFSATRELLRCVQGRF